MENIILVGMPACGKSITGVVLAKTMRMNFVDTDLLIQERVARSRCSKSSMNMASSTSNKQKKLFCWS